MKTSTLPAYILCVLTVGPLLSGCGAVLVGGAAIIETLFAWPGMGRLAVEAVTGRDYALIMAVTTIAACLTVLGNLVADLAYAAIDPRVRYDRD